jgi:hypothetical protein
LLILGGFDLYSLSDGYISSLSLPSTCASRGGHSSSSSSFTLSNPQLILLSTNGHMRCQSSNSCLCYSSTRVGVHPGSRCGRRQKWGWILCSRTMQKSISVDLSIIRSSKCRKGWQKSVCYRLW